MPSYNDWLSNVSGYKSPGGGSVGASSYSQLAKSMLSDFLSQTGANSYLAPDYIRRLRDQASKIYAAYAIHKGGSGQLPGEVSGDEEDYGEFLKKWFRDFGAGSKFGWGAGLKDLMGQIGSSQGNQGEFAKYWNSDEDAQNLLANMSYMNRSGPMGGYLRNKMMDISSDYDAMTARRGGEGESATTTWYDYLKSNAPWMW